MFSGAEGHAGGVGQPLREHLYGDEVEGDAGKHAGSDQALVKGGHDLAAAAKLDEEGADDGGDDRDAAEDQRVADGCRRCR